MTLLEQMKADAEACNRRMRRFTGVGQKTHAGNNNGKSSAVASRHAAIRAMMGTGITQAEMAERMSVSIDTIKGDIQTIRVEDTHAQS